MLSFLFPCYQSAAPRRSPEINAESPGEHPFPRSPIHYGELGGSLPPHLPHSSSLTLTARRRPFKFISPRPGQALSVKLRERERAERGLLSPVCRGGRGGEPTCPCEGLGKRLVRDTQLIMARINLLDLLPGGRRGVNTACAEAVWKHNVSVYRKNINTSSPLWVIDGGTGEGQPGAGRVTESQELARDTDPVGMNRRGPCPVPVSPWWAGAAASRPGSPQLTQIPQEEKGDPLQCWGCTSGSGWTAHPVLRVMQNPEQNCFGTSKPPRLALRSP